MTCANCEDIRITDGEPPDCESGRDCIVPLLGPEEARIMEIRDRLAELNELCGPEYICMVYGVTKSDLALIAAVEREVSKNRDKNGA